jgi:hypothetical protein
MENMNQNNGKTTDYIKKYLPVSALILLTILLMVFFRLKKNDIGRLLEKGKNNLVSFYAQNLQPLFATTDISNEDVFNFALYQSLPIDKQNNKVLTISDQGSDNQVYEIKPIAYNPQTNNYEKFVQYLGLNQNQKEQADSILNLYKKELYLSVLMNNKNTVAVSSKIGELQKAALADMLNFARNVNPKKAWEIFPGQHEFNNDVKHFIVSTQENPQNEFVFITPDTAFKTICTIDSKDLEKAINLKIKSVATPNPPVTPEKANWGFDFSFSDESANKKSSGSKVKSIVSVRHPDSNFFKVVIPIPAIPLPPQVDDSIRIKLDKAAKKLRNLSIVFGNREKELKKISERNSRQNKSDVELYFQDPTEIVGKTMEMLSKQNFKSWDEFGEKMDSIASSFAASYSDSLVKKNKTAIEALKNLKKNKFKTAETAKDSVNINQIK